MKVKQLRNNIVVIKRSCLTGQPVWVYIGPTKNAAKQAYKRAKRKEIERIKAWPEKVAQFRASVLALLNRCMENIPITSELTPEQQAAAKELLAYANEEPEYDMSFYEHITEERRRRAEDMEIRRKMRERKMAEKRNYDK